MKITKTQNQNAIEVSLPLMETQFCGYIKGILENVFHSIITYTYRKDFKYLAESQCH